MGRISQAFVHLKWTGPQTFGRSRQPLSTQHVLQILFRDIKTVGWENRAITTGKCPPHPAPILHSLTPKVEHLTNIGRLWA